VLLRFLEVVLARHFSRVPWLVSLALCSACAAGGSGNQAIPAQSFARSAPDATGGSYLYALTSYPSVEIFAPGSNVAQRTIKLAVGALAITLDKNDNLYVASAATSGKQNGSVAIFAAGSSTPTAHITAGVELPLALTLDASERNLYVANEGGAKGGWVSVYSTSTHKLLRKIRKGMQRPVGLALGPGGNLYVNNYAGTVTVYKAGTSTLVQTIETGIYSPVQIAFDGAWNLYVANFSPGGGSIIIFPPGQTTPSRTISSANLGSPTVEAVDPSGDFYVGSTVDAKDGLSSYLAGKMAPHKVIKDAEFFQTASLARDPDGNVYVAYFGGYPTGNVGSITVFGPHLSSILNTIALPATRVTAMAFGSR
jgi:hypothetical protein